MPSPRQSRSAVLDRDVGDSRAEGHELAEHLGVDARGEDEVGLHAPEPVGADDAGEIQTGAHPDELRSDALALEGLEVRSAVTERGHVRIEAACPELRQ